MSQYLDKDGASRIAENFLSKQAEQDAILRNLQFDLKEAEHALVKTIQGPAPLNIRALSRPLTDYLISGNTTQTGTPTPEAPVDVVGCGVRTGNLLFKKIVNGGINPSGEVNETTFYNLFVANVTEGDTVTVSNFAESYAFYGSEPAIGSISIDGTRYLTYDTPYTIAIPNGAEYIAVRAYATQDNTMLNLGSTPLPYEPYGYKLPLTIGGTEYPIYLGQVESTRRIKKIVFDGTEEGWERSYIRAGCFALRGFGTGVVEKAMYCTHATCVSTASQLTSNNTSYMGNDFNIWLDLFNAQTSNEQFKSYLAAQYAAGTPVTVWYVLAEPEIGIVNEPLHKIGNYADTLSMEQAGVTLTTTKGFNTITTDTAVLPSNIEVKGVINNA